MAVGFRLRARILLALGSLLLSILVAELAFRIVDPLGEARRAAAGAPDDSGRHIPVGSSSKRVHPFQAWTRIPGHRPAVLGNRRVFPDGKPTEWALANSTTNQFGFFSYLEDYRELSEQHFVIAIFGGSVARDLAVFGGDALREEAAERLAMPLDQVAVLNAAAGGYKQPQQVATLSQLLLLGVPIDVVINLDGFNEVVFGRLNAARGVHPLSPSLGHYSAVIQLSASKPDDTFLLDAARVVRHRRAVQHLRQRLGYGLGKRSVLVQSALTAASRWHEERASRLEVRLQRPGDTSLAVSPPAALPESCVEARTPCWKLITDLWQRSSLQMAALSAAVGAEYVHVLQPNQYIEGTKRLTSSERELAWEPSSHYGIHPPAGYRYLRRAGSRLARGGVNFHDLTTVFLEVEEPIYVDSCCHMNLFGNRLLARAIADRIPLPSSTSRRAAGEARPGRPALQR